MLQSKEGRDQVIRAHLQILPCKIVYLSATLVVLFVIILSSKEIIFWEYILVLLLENWQRVSEKTQKEDPFLKDSMVFHSTLWWGHVDLQ